MHIGINTTIERSMEKIDGHQPVKLAEEIKQFKINESHE